jgi:hypothetical protein
MRVSALLLLLETCSGSVLGPGGPRALRSMNNAANALLDLRGGAAEPSDALLQATYACNQLSAQVLSDAMSEVAALRKGVSGGETIPTFGAKVDEIVADAVDKFTANTPKGESDVSALYQAKGEEVRAALVTSLEPVFVQQVCLLKDAAMEDFKKGMLGDGDASEALASAEAAFVREAGASVPGKTGWSFKIERASLVGAMQAILTEQKKAQSAKMQTAQQMQTALSYLRTRQLPKSPPAPCDVSCTRAPPSSTCLIGLHP